MIISNNQWLSSVRLSRRIEDAARTYADRLPLRFLDRCRIVGAEDDEITGTFVGRTFMADLIADDQAAVVYEAGQLTFVTSNIPNIKVGRRLGQGTLNRLNRLRENGGLRGDRDTFFDWETDTTERLLRGVRERMNALCCSMMLDSTVYNRLGIQINGTWGMPSDLKVTVSPLWTDPASPSITQILTLKQYAADTYGEGYDRLTLSTSDLLLLVATTEFRTLIAGLVNAPLEATAFNTRDRRNVGFLSQLLDMEIETEDRQGTVQNADGTQTTSRILPLGKVLLSTKADDRTGAAFDFANAIVTESIVAPFIGGPSELSGQRTGPIAYYTGQADLNPPNLQAWAVARGFPRKHRPTSTAVMTVR